VKSQLRSFGGRWEASLARCSSLANTLEVRRRPSRVPDVPAQVFSCLAAWRMKWGNLCESVLLLGWVGWLAERGAVMCRQDAHFHAGEDARLRVVHGSGFLRGG